MYFSFRTTTLRYVSSSRNLRTSQPIIVKTLIFYWKFEKPCPERLKLVEISNMKICLKWSRTLAQKITIKWNKIKWNLIYYYLFIFEYKNIKIIPQLLSFFIYIEKIKYLDRIKSFAYLNSYLLNMNHKVKYTSFIADMDVALFYTSILLYCILMIFMTHIILVYLTYLIIS